MIELRQRGVPVVIRDAEIEDMKQLGLFLQRPPKWPDAGQKTPLWLEIDWIMTFYRPKRWV